MKILRELRNDIGITLEQLSGYIGFSKSIVSKWERGDSQPTASAIIKLAQYYNVTADYLLGLDKLGYTVELEDKEFRYSVDQATKVIFDEVQKLDSLSKQNILGYIRGLSKRLAEK